MTGPKTGGRSIGDQKAQILRLQDQLVAQGKDVSVIKGSNIVTGKSPVKVEVTNPSNSGKEDQAWAFSPEKADAFIAGTKTATAKFTVVTAVDDSQSNRFGLEVLSLLKRAGWSATNESPARTPWTGRFQGVIIKVSHIQFQAASNLQYAFRELGLSAEGQVDSSVPSDLIEIDVGYKPDYWKY